MTLIKFQKPGKSVMVNNPFFPSLNSMLDNFFNVDYNYGESIPAVNVSETENEFKIDYQVPGFKKEEIKIGFDNGILSVSGEKQSETNEENKRFTRKEFSHTSFKRSFSVPENADADKMSARYENGVLQVSIPKVKPVEKSNTRQISIE